MKLMPWRNKKTSEPRDIASPSRGAGFDIERIFDRFLSDPWFGGSWRNGEFFGAGSWAPPVDVTETETEVHVRSEIPGVDPKDLSITVSDGVLTLSGEKSESTEKRDENYYHSERRFGSFRRNVQLPASVDPDQVNAEYDNGVLTVTLKRQEGATVKRIPVSAKK